MTNHISFYARAEGPQCPLWVISGHLRCKSGMSALPPIATAKADFRNKVMSALPPKADMCGATRDVRFGPLTSDLQSRRTTRTNPAARLIAA